MLGHSEKSTGQYPARIGTEVHHDAEDQRAYLHGLQRNGFSQGEAASAGNSQNLSGEVRGLWRQGKFWNLLMRTEGYES